MASADASSDTPCPVVDGRDAYVPPARPARVDLRLDGNEGPPAPREFVEQLLADPESIRRYPDAAPLETAIAASLGVDPGRVLVTAGGDDAIDRACRAFLCPGRGLVGTSPTFEMIARYARLAGATVCSVPWMQGHFPTNTVLGACNASTGMIAIVSPNNPTGAVARPDDLRDLSRAVPGALLLVDLAYTEFADQDLTPEALRLPNAVAIRSFSKAWGLAGLRVGYAVGPPGIIASMRAAGHPYPVSRPSLQVAMARLHGSREDVRGFVDRVRLERSRLATLLEELGARPLPSQSNFVLARFQHARFVHDALAALGIAVRAFAGRGSLEDWLRTTCPGDPGEWERLEHALRTVLAPRALIFDMDGVLADVSQSYRAAIQATAGSFGVALGPGAIARAKAEANSNNDWELTHRLLARHGVQAGPEEVRDCFERFYQGTPGRPGFHAAERLACDPVLLDRLSNRLPLAVVTGRPRRDAERFLAAQGIEPLVRVLVCMEDAPPKPDPAPVREALRRLGLRHAWMLGDTPDDLEAARRAGVLPLGVVAPGDDGDEARAALQAAGAAGLLERTDQIEEWMP